MLRVLHDGTTLFIVFNIRANKQLASVRSRDDYISRGRLIFFYIAITYKTMELTIINIHSKLYW